MYIALEGIDTCGKSTQITALSKILSPNNVIFTKEPGGSALGEKIRDLILFSHLEIATRAEFLLFLADRAQHYKEVLYPNRHKLIIADRSAISSIAYAKDIPLEDAIALNRFALNHFLPDLVIILELDKDTLQKRINAKKSDNIESRGIEYMLEIQSRIINATKMLQIPFVIINASENVEAICEQILHLINNH